MTIMIIMTNCYDDYDKLLQRINLTIMTNYYDDYDYCVPLFFALVMTAKPQDCRPIAQTGRRIQKVEPLKGLPNNIVPVGGILSPIRGSTLSRVLEPKP